MQEQYTLSSKGPTIKHIKGRRKTLHGYLNSFIEDNWKRHKQNKKIRAVLKKVMMPIFEVNQCKIIHSEMKVN